MSQLQSSVSSHKPHLMQSLVHHPAPQQCQQVSSSEREGRWVWGLHRGAGPAVSTTSGLLPDWLGCEWGVSGTRQGKGQSGKRPSSALSGSLITQGVQGFSQLLKTFLSSTEPRWPKSTQEKASNLISIHLCFCCPQLRKEQKMF